MPSSQRDGVLVSWQGFCATQLNIFKCLHNRAPEASLFGSSYCQDFPKYEADHINTNCSHPPDRSSGGKEKKRKRKICLTSPPSSSVSLSSEAAQTCWILLHRVGWNSTNGDSPETAQNGEKTQTNSSQKETFPDVLY